MTTATAATDTRRRVKLYALNADRQWDDRGTGHVSSQYIERLKGQSLLVRAESDGSVLLESRIASDTAYQKQQETLIVWSEGDNYDLALSFQEKVGCDEIWAKICAVQGKDPSVDITQDIQDDDDCDGRYETVELPDPELLDDVCDLIVASLPYPLKREKLAIALESDNYIRKLLKVFRDCEAKGKTEKLRKLFEIFKNIFLLNKNPLFEVMLSDESLWDIIGVLEYDPQSQRKHRDYLRNDSQFKEVIPFANSELIQKIHQTYRVQYIQDIILPTPSVFEENILSTLSSFIFFNKVEIVSLIQDDDKFLRQLFSELTSEETRDAKRRDLILFLKEFCTFSQTLQPQNRENFFKSLSSYGILSTIESTLANHDPIVKSSSADILTFVVEYSPSMIRDYVLSESPQQKRDIVNVIIEEMISADSELGLQLSAVVRLLIDPENMINSNANKSEKTDFLNYFYRQCMHVLIRPLFSAQQQSPQLLSIIIELLSFSVEHHAYHIRNFIIQKDLLRRVLSFMSTKYAFLALTALRFLRKIIQLKDEFYNRHVISGSLFTPVVDALLANNGRYNLLDSAIVELFEFIRTEEIKSLCSHVIEKFGKTFERITYVRTFKGLRLQYEQHSSSTKDASSPSMMIRQRYTHKRDPRQMEEDEEMWFNADDDDDECDDCDSYKLDSEFESFQKKVIERKSALMDIDSVKKSETEFQRKKKGLVDYDEDSDSDSDSEDADDEQKSEPIVKRSRLS